MQKYRTLLLLLAAYAAATWLPGPGLWLRNIDLLSTSIRPPQVLLAALLFSAGLCSSRGAVQTIVSSRERLLLLALAAWLVPLAAALCATLGIYGLLGGPASVALGIVIVAAMPVANSSVGWATSMGGSVPLSIALLVVGTALSPLLTPMVIGAGAISLGTAEEALTRTPWSEGMGLFFLVWVLIPVLLGVWSASRFSPSISERVVPAARSMSFIILILLNYLNGAPCLPALAQQPHLLIWPVLASGTLLLLSSGCVWLVPRLLPVTQLVPVATPALPSSSEPPPAERISLLLAVVMRNTGAALVFAGAALPEYVLVSLTIIAYTMLQHCWVGFFLSPQASVND